MKRVQNQRGIMLNSIRKVPPKVGQANRKIKDELNKLLTKRQSKTTIQETTMLSSGQNIKSKRTATAFLI